MNNPAIKIYLLNEDETIYYSVGPQNPNGSYGTLPTSLPTPIITLPIGWEKTEIKWERHPQYKGCFRSQTDSFIFVEDARWILMRLMYQNGGGVQATCIMRIDQFGDVNTGYSTAYKCELDFTQAEDVKYNNGVSYQPRLQGEFRIPTLDSKLFSYLQSQGNTVFNSPMFQLNPAGGWVTDAEFVVHDGIKLLYNATYTTSAAKDTPLVFGDTSSGVVQIGGFKNGEHGTGIHNGVHKIVAMNRYDFTQANGSTTFVGNDILEKFLIQGTQSESVNNSSPGETNFAGTNNSRPFTTNNNILKNILPTLGVGNNSINMNWNVNFKITDVLPPFNAIQWEAPSGMSWGDARFGVALFEIDQNDNPEILSGLSGQYTPHAVYWQTIFDVTSYPEINQSIPITVNYLKVYIACLLFDGVTIPIDSSKGITYISFDKLECSFLSAFDSGASGVPIPAPKLNASVFPAYRLHQLLEKIVPYFESRSTDGYGFPVPNPSTSFVGVSDFLSNPAQTAIGDCVPYQIMITSEFCIHSSAGRPYISASLNQIFNFCNKVLGCGLSIDSDGNTLRIERLANYFQSAVEIINLDDYNGVANFTIKPYKDGLGASLKLGYDKAETNSDFGIDAEHTELVFTTPLYKISGEIDFQESEIIVEPYAIEKLRAQHPPQLLGDTTSSGSNNKMIGLYCQPSTTVILPNSSQDSPYDFSAVNPDGTPFAVAAYQLTQRNGVAPFGGSPTPYSPCAQSTDNTAFLAPYIYGKYYPDTAYNVELSPCRILKRDGGALLHSVLDLMEDADLVFRNTYIMNFNNEATTLSGIESNLQVGGGGNVITEFKDIEISSLPAKLFRPYLFEITTVSPVNMWSIMNSNPNGYISFTWKNRVYKGFIMNVTQRLAQSAPTSYELLAHPDTTNDDLLNA